MIEITPSVHSSPSIKKPINAKIPEIRCSGMIARASTNEHDETPSYELFLII
jgi:hypothetical protein